MIKWNNNFTGQWLATVGEMNINIINKGKGKEHYHYKIYDEETFFKDGYTKSLNDAQIISISIAYDYAEKNIKKYQNMLKKIKELAQQS